MPHAQIQNIVCPALEFRILATQGYKINYAAVQYKVITMLCHHIKIANHVYLIPVISVQMILHVRLALVIKIKAILGYFPIALVQPASILTHLSKLIASVYFIFKNTKLLNLKYLL